MAGQTARTDRGASTQFSRQDAINFALMAQDITNIKTRLQSIDDNLKQQVQSINDDLKDDFVKKEEFTPVKNLVYGFVVLIVIAVIGAIMALVIVHPGEPTQVTTSVPVGESSK